MLPLRVGRSSACVLTYVGLVLVGVLISYGAGRIAENWSQTTSLIVFLCFFFATLYASWQIARRVA
jgi:TRAP-type C4-dicarboxylate transport system permease small subunit